MSETAEKEAKLQASRQKFVEDSRFDPTHPRYGLFSFTGTLAIGDDSIGKRMKPKRDSDGRVETGPRNFYTKPVRSGRTKDVYFSVPSFHTVGDKYVDPNKILSRTRLAPPKEDVPPFKPGGAVTWRHALYPHISLESPTAKAQRDKDGSVQVGPKNFVVSPPKKGLAGATPGLTFGSFPAVTDPYDRKRQLEREERLRQKALIKHDRAFRSNSPGDRDFTTGEETYGKTQQDTPRTIRVTKSAVFAEHDRPFKPPNPTKTGVIDMTIGKYPEHKPCPEAKPPSPPHFEHPWRCPTYRTSYKERTAPTASVVGNLINLRSEFTVLKRK